MSNSIAARLTELGVELPVAAAPAANYLPFVIHDGLLHISGQLPMGPDGIVYSGKLGAEQDVESGQAAARLCAINILAQASAALGDLERIERVIRINVFVNSAADFADQPMVANGASNFLAEVLEDAGRHTRNAVGCANLPFNASVEIDATIAIKP